VSDVTPIPPPAAALAAELLHIGATCPKCGAAPALRIGTAARGVLGRVLRPASVAFSYQCQRRGCSEVYLITVEDLVRRDDGTSRRRGGDKVEDRSP
jgi:hypothetical protein